MSDNEGASPAALFITFVLGLFYQDTPPGPDAIGAAVAAYLAEGEGPPTPAGLAPELAAITLVGRAWELAEQDQPEEGLELAVLALRAYPASADAFWFIGSMLEDEIGAAMPFFTLGVMGGFEALGEPFIAEHMGRLWEAPEARGFLSCMGALARANRDAGAIEEAARLYAQMLELNTNDEQGARYDLVACALQGGNLDLAESVMAAYPEEGTAFAFARALLELQRGGDNDPARLALRAAQAKNAHVVPVLTGVARLPEELGDEAAPGSLEEAIVYAELMGPSWEAAAGAIDWLRRQVAMAPPAPPAKERRAGPREV